MKKVQLDRKHYGVIGINPGESNAAVNRQKKKIRRMSKGEKVESFSVITLSEDSEIEDSTELIDMRRKVRWQDYVYIAEPERFIESNILVWLIKEREVVGFQILTPEPLKSYTKGFSKRLMKIIEGLSEYDKEYANTVFKTPLKNKKERGERVGIIPFGFEVAEDKKTLIPNNEEQKVISKIVHLKDKSKYSLRQIKEELDKQKFKSPSGSLWSRMTIQNILKREDRGDYAIAKKRTSRKRVKLKRREENSK